jgi:N12 class adenine-specific DNA methylase
LQTLFAITDQEREATDRERAALAAFSGWGGAPQAFVEDGSEGPEWAEVNAVLRHTLSNDEYDLARASTLTAFYTPGPVASAILSVLSNVGYGHSEVPDAILEPGCGTGNFMRVVPEDLNLRFFGVEVEETSAEIAQALLPDQVIVNAPMEDCLIPEGSFAAAVGNVPFCESVTIDGMPIHDWFIRRAIESVRPGGLVALITSRYTFDKSSAKSRRWIAERASLAGAVRLPARTFHEQAGTDVVSDILVFQRHEEGAREGEELPEWVDTGLVPGSMVRANRLFLDHPEFVIGTGLAVGSGPYGPTLDVPPVPGMDATALGETVRRVLGEQVTRHVRGDIHERLGEARSTPSVIPEVRGIDACGLLNGPNGSVLYRHGDLVQAFVPRHKGDLERVRDMVGLRDEAKGLFELERRPDVSDTEISEAIGRLDASYDAFVAAHGRLHDRRNADALRLRDYPDPSISLNLMALERIDDKGRFVAKADALSKRTVRPVPKVPDHVENPEEAMQVSLSLLGRLDEGFMAQLLGIRASELDATLGDLAIRDPEDGRLLTADEYLSGNIQAKLDHVRARIRELGPERERSLERSFLQSLDPEFATPSDSERHVWEEFRHELDGVCHPLTSTHAELMARVQDSLDDVWVDDKDVRRGFPALLSTLLGELDGDAMGLLGARDMTSHTTKICQETFDAFVKKWVNNSGTDYLFGYVRISPGWVDGTFGVLWAALDARDRGLPQRWLDRILNGVGWEAAYALSVVTGIKLDVTTRYADLVTRHPKAVEYLALLEDLQRNSPERILDLFGSDPVSTDGLKRFLALRERFCSEHSGTREEAEARAQETQRLGGLERRLTEALPTRLGPSEITATPSSPWIPVAYVRDFCVETFGIDGDDRTNGQKKTFSVTREPLTGTWRVKGSMTSIPEAVWNEYGTAELTPLQLLESSMNAAPIHLTKPDDSDPTGKKRVGDPAATAAALEKRSVIEEAFQRWVWADPDRARNLTRIYNERVNCLKPREYDGSALTFPGMNPDIELREHQRDAVARCLLSDEGTLVAHVVGAGKTFTGVAACHESRRLGLANKPIIVVPNHLTLQWASDFLELYPGDKVLVMGKDEARDAKAVATFWATARAGDWDAVIVPQSRFSMLGLSPKIQKEFLESRIEEISLAIEVAREDEDKMSVKSLEKARARARSRVNSLNNSQRREGELFFDDMGFDMILVDEAHTFKNLMVAGRSVAGMGGTSSAKCEDLLAKCEYLRQEGHGGNIVFATGTPVSNTMGELYNMQRYLAPGTLRQLGCEAFPSWAGTFGQVVQGVELKPEGTGFQIKSRFARFVNLPELMCSFHSFSDVLTADQVDLDVPECEEIPVPVEATESQRSMVASLAKRAEKVRNGDVDPEEDNLLKITSDGRKVALDPKLLDWDLAPMRGGKIQRCAENVFRLWREYGEQRAAQLVFCDSSTDAFSSEWNVYKSLKDRLVALGVPAEQIAFISEAKNATQRDALFERVREGVVRVLIGSTQRLGTGTNVQTRLIAIHDLDCPWRPADLDQRKGRIQRQGNSFKKVFDYRYVTVGTFDAYCYQTVERKQKFIGQVFTSKSPARSAEDLDDMVLSYAEIKALATGDPKVAERMNIENRIGQLQLMKQGFARQANDARNRINLILAPKVHGLEVRCEAHRRDHDAFAKVLAEITAERQGKGGKEDGRDTEVGKLPSDASHDQSAAKGNEGSVPEDAPKGKRTPGITAKAREAVRRKRIQRFERELHDKAILGATASGASVGEYHGLTVWARQMPLNDSFGGRQAQLVACGLQADEEGPIHWSLKSIPSPDGHGWGPCAYLNSIVRTVAGPVEDDERKLAEARRDLESAKATADAPFKYEGELRKLRARLAEYDRQAQEASPLQAEVERDDQGHEEVTMPSYAVEGR